MIIDSNDLSPIACVVRNNERAYVLATVNAQMIKIAELEAKLAEAQNAAQAAGEPITANGTHGFVGGGGGNPPGAGANCSAPSELH